MRHGSLKHGGRKVAASKGVQGQLAAWYDSKANVLGWIGLGLLALSFFNKEFVQKKLEEQKARIEAGTKAVEADELSRVQVQSNRVYGSEKMDPLESDQIRLESILKFASKEGYFDLRITSLWNNESIGRSNFLVEKGITAEQLRAAAQSLMPMALSATNNLFQCRRAEKSSETKIFGMDVAAFRKQVFDEAENVFESEHSIDTLINEWAEKERNSLKQQQAGLAQKASVDEVVTLLLFLTGLALAIGEKVAGKKGPKPEIPGTGE